MRQCIAGPRCIAASVTLLIAVGLVAAVPVQVASAQTAPSNLAYGFSPQSGPPGTVVTFAGTGCPHAERAGSIRSDGQFEIFRNVGAGVNSGSFLNFQTFQSQANGFFRGEITIPPGSARGPHQTSVFCRSTGGQRVLGRVFVVDAPTPPPPPPPSLFRVFDAVVNCAATIGAVAAFETAIAVGAGVALAKVGGLKAIHAGGAAAFRGPQGAEFVRQILETVEKALEVVPLIGRFAGALIYRECRPAQILLNRYLA